MTEKTTKSLTAKRIGTPSYNPANLLDEIIVRKGLKNDSALSALLQISPVMVSKVRASKLEISAGILLRMHDVTEISIAELRTMMGETA